MHNGGQSTDRTCRSDRGRRYLIKISSRYLIKNSSRYLIKNSAFNPTNDQYAAFFPSDHTSRQMHCFLEHLLMHYTTAETLHNGEFLPIDIQATYLFFRGKLILSVQGRLSLHILCNAVRHGNIHQLIIIHIL